MKSMALLKCYECGKEISDKAPSCPHCGAPKLVATNKKVKTKKSLVFSKYLKPIGIGLGVVVLPLAAVASVPLIQANGNVDAVVWRFKNKKFIDSRCVHPLRHLKNTSLPKGCKSILYKLGKKAEKVSWSSHHACISQKKIENPKVYSTCVNKWDKEYARRKRKQRLSSGPLDQTIGGLELSEITSFCKKKASNQILDYESCMHMYAKGWNGTPKPQLEIFTHKGKTYTATRKCPVGQNMYWSITSGFMRKTKVSELGCMTKAQNETFWRDYKLRKAGAPRSSGSGYDATLRMDMETKRIQNNMHQNYMNRYERWREREFGY